MTLGLVTERTTGTESDHMIEFKEGVELLKNEYPEKALLKLRRAFESEKRNPYYISFLGLTIARAEQNWEQALDLCETAVKLNSKKIKFHLNLIEVYALAGWREKALRKLDHASKLFGDDSRLKRFRSKIVQRRGPVLPFLGKIAAPHIEAPSEKRVMSAAARAKISKASKERWAKFRAILDQVPD